MADRPEIGTALTAIRGRLPEYTKARQYLAGKQADVYSRREWVREMGKDIAQPRDNMTRSIVETLVSRLKPQAFAPMFPGVAGSAKAADVAQVIWKRNRMDEQAPEVHRTAGTTGDAFVLVGEIAGKAVITRQAPENCHVEYDPSTPGRVLWGAKWWVETGRVRINVYLPEATHRFVTNRDSWAADKLPQQVNAFQPYDGDGQPAVIANPTGRVQLFHFPNAAPTGEYGRSELSDCYSLVDHINSGLCDLVLAMRAVGVPWRVITGVSTSKTTAAPALGADLTLAVPLGESALVDADPSAFVEEDELDGGPGKAILLENENAKAYQLDAATLDGPIKFLDTLRLAVARMCRRPVHTMMLGSEKLATATEVRTAEAGFLAEVEARQTTWGNVWEDVMSYAVQVEQSHDATGFTTLAEMHMLELAWGPAELTTDATESELLKAAVDAGLPLADLLVRFFGFSQEDADAVAARKVAEAEAAASLGGSLFDAGVTG